MRCFGTKKDEETEEKEQQDGMKDEHNRQQKKRRRGGEGKGVPKSEGEEPNEEGGGEVGAMMTTRMNGGTATKKKLNKRRRSRTKQRQKGEGMETEQKQMLQNRDRRTARANGAPAGGATLAEGGGGIELAKITERFFALLYPSGSDTLYRQNIKSVSDRIKRTFADRYKIFNLSQKRSDLGRANPQGAVVELGWPDTLAPPLDRLCSICKQIENHLNVAEDTVTVIHCKGGLYRAGIVVAAFMHYSTICESEANVADRFSMKLFTEKFLGFDAQPSHKRYVSYFANLLSGSVKVYPSPIFLSHFALSRIFPGRMVTLKLYERMKPIWSSGKISLTDHSVVSLAESALSLRGDVLLKCCGVPSLNGAEKQLLFQCQFNTCALSLEALDSPKLRFFKDDLDYVHEPHLLASSASLELSFELADPRPPAVASAAANAPTLNNRSNNRSSTSVSMANPAKQHQQRKSASPARMASAGPMPTIVAGGDFSRVDSYENFERAEDERSLSLPIANSVPTNNGTVIGKEEDSGKGGGAVSAQPVEEQQNQQKQQRQRVQAVPATQPQSQATVTVADGADSGIGSDSPRTQPQPLSQHEIMPEMTSTSVQQADRADDIKERHFFEVGQGTNEVPTSNRKMPPPPVPPKSRRNSSMDLDEMESNDPMRSAYEDSTIGRDHSVLPPGARPTFGRTFSAQGTDGMPEGSSSDEKGATEGTTRKVCPMVQPELVAMGRYDPNSRCFSYVPVKALKEHYSAPKKPTPALKRRVSVVDDLEMPATPTEAQLALQNLGQHKASNGDVRRRAETPKWEAEIDKVTGRAEPLPERRPRRSSASFTPVGQLQRDYVRSPSAQVRSPQEEWRLRQHLPQQRRTEPLEAALNECYERRFNADRGERDAQFISGAAQPQRDIGTRAREAHTMPRAQTPRDPISTQHAHAERPTVLEQAKRATPVHFSSQLGHQSPVPLPPPLGLRLSSSVPAPSKLSPRSTGRREMDTLCDPNFYLSYSTQNAKEPTKQSPPQGEDLLSKSIPNERIFNRMAQNELMRDDVRDLLAEHRQLGGAAPRRSQTPQHLGRNQPRLGAAPPIQHDEFRTRNCRSVTSTPLIGSRKLFLNGTEDTFGADSDNERGADDWLNAKLRALRGKRYIPPEAEEQRKKTERLLLEELKQKSTSVHEAPRGGDPLEEFRREEQRLKETQSPLLMDNPLRMANKNLQKERARQFLLNQPLQTIEPFRTFPSQQRDQTATRSPLPFNSMPLSITTAKQTQTFYQQPQQSNRNVESPVSLLPQVRRGATPTGQIVRGKPPTPPPSLSRDDRARSKSPYALKLLRGVSNSAPPAMAKKGQQQNHVEAAEERRESNPMVNPQLYALRQSLYAKERERIGGGGRTTEGVAFAEPDEERTRQNGIGRAEESLFISSGHSPYSFSVSSPTTFTHNHHIPTPPSSAPSFAFEQRTHPPVKPILKRSGTNDGKQNETAQKAEQNWQRQKQQMNANYEENGEKTKNESQRKDKRDGGQMGNGGQMGDGQMGDGQKGYRQMGGRRESGERAADAWGNAGGRPGRVKTLDEESRPVAFSRATTNQTADIGERSDTPQFPVTERTETPLPYHPLLYRRDSTTEEMVTQRQQWAPNGQKIEEPTMTSSNRNNSNTTMNRIGAITPHGMDGTSAAAGGSNRRASLSQSAFVAVSDDCVLSGE
ncbi:hypothetical protein niasHT_015477 [Heterodera trifolii]|uniref:Uncharacterized protein n=1 Tax=Heterodera trifolii TaxID=157864 RepID=A0ABD2L003_9BILA